MQLENASREPPVAAAGFSVLDDPHAAIASTQLMTIGANMKRLGIELVVPKDG
jgi:hypothetical protein